MLNVMCANNTVINPKEKFGKMLLHAMNNSIREIPVTISALSIGMFVTPIIKVLALLFKACIPIAPAVPMIVAIKAERSAIIKVVYKALMMSVFKNRFLYHLRENPPHFAEVLEELNDNTIKVIIGA